MSIEKLKWEGNDGQCVYTEGVMVKYPAGSQISGLKVGQ
jgi:hypothetical protein